MFEWLAIFWHWVSNLGPPAPGWAALWGAIIGALFGYVAREIEEHRRRRRERNGIITLLRLEIKLNEELLNTYVDKPEKAYDSWRRTLSTRAWDEASMRLTQLLKDEILLANLAEYYEQARAISSLAEHPYGANTVGPIVRDMLPNVKNWAHV